MLKEQRGNVVKVEIEIKSELRCFVATVEGHEFRSEDTSAESLTKLWGEILDAKIFDEDEEQADRWFDEEYYPEWPESISRILKMCHNQCLDGWAYCMDY